MNAVTPLSHAKSWIIKPYGKAVIAASLFFTISSTAFVFGTYSLIEQVFGEEVHRVAIAIIIGLHSAFLTRAIGVVSTNSAIVLLRQHRRAPVSRSSYIGAILLMIVMYPLCVIAKGSGSANTVITFALATLSCLSALFCSAVIAAKYTYSTVASDALNIGWVSMARTTFKTPKVLSGSIPLASLLAAIVLVAPSYVALAFVVAALIVWGTCVTQMTLRGRVS